MGAPSFAIAVAAQWSGSGLCYDSVSGTCAACVAADACEPIPENAVVIDEVCGWQCLNGYVEDEAGTVCVESSDGFFSVGGGALCERRVTVCDPGTFLTGNCTVASSPECRVCDFMVMNAEFVSECETACLDGLFLDGFGHCALSCPSWFGAYGWVVPGKRVFHRSGARRARTGLLVWCIRESGMRARTIVSMRALGRIRFSVWWPECV